MPSTSLTDFRNQFVTRAKTRINAIDLASADDNALLVAGAMLRSLDAVARFDEASADAPQLLAAMTAAELDAYVATADGREAFERVLTSTSALTALASSGTFKAALLGTAVLQVLWFTTPAALAACQSSPLWAGAKVLKAPVLTSPSVTTTTRTPALTSGAAAWWLGADVHSASQWQIATDTAFTVVVKDSGEDAVNKTSWLPSGTLAKDTDHHVRVRFKGAAAGWGPWSPSIAFRTHAVDPFVVALSADASGSYQEGMKALACAADGSIYGVGELFSPVTSYSSILVSKWAADGTLAWQKRLDSGVNGAAYAISISADGSVLVAGKEVTNGWLAKLTAEGAITWQKRLGASASTILRGVAMAADGSIYAVGQEGSAGYGWIGKFAANGSNTWQKRLGVGGNSSESFNALAIAADGAIYAAGSIVHNTYRRHILVKFAADGSITWQKTLEGAGAHCGFYALAIAADGALYAAGDNQVAPFGALLTKWAADGTLTWQKTLGTSGSMPIYGLAPLPEGGTYAVGNDGAGNALFSRWTAAGALDWAKALDGYSSSNLANAAAVAGNGLLYAALDLYRSTSVYYAAGLVAVLSQPATGALPSMTEQSWIASGVTAASAGWTATVSASTLADSTLAVNAGGVVVNAGTGTAVKSLY